MKNFWEKLPRPIMALAPMANVTDAAFRRVIAEFGKPDVMFTEFVSADGLMSAGREALLVDLKYSEAERPIVAQLFSANPQKMERAARLVTELGFDGLDINLGCPDRTIEKQGAGAALIKNPKLAQEIILAAQAGAPDLPVSVKTRLGYNRDELDPPTGGWLSALLEVKPAAITIHARTRKEMSKVPARWERIKRAVEIRNELDTHTLILGNGDANSLADAKIKVAESGADGAMLGRAVFGNPWLFANPRSCLKTLPQGEALTPRTVLGVLLYHTKLFSELLGSHKNFAIMKKHYKAYVNGFTGASELRAKLMATENYRQVEEIITPLL